MPDNMGQATLLVNFIGNPAGLIAAVKSSKGAIAALKIGAIAASAAILIGFGAAIKTAINFETSMRNVQSIGKFTDKTFHSMSASVIKLSQVIPKTAKDLAEGLYFIYSSGFKGKEAMAVLEWSARGASAGLATTADSAKALVGVMNAYNKKTAPDAQKFMDIMFKTVDKGVIEFDELAQTLGMVINTAAVAKVPFEEVGAAIGLMTIKGIKANMATVSLNRVILAFLKPSENMKDLIKEIGYETGETALKEEGLEGMMIKVIEATGGSATALRDLFPEQRAFRGATAMAGGSVKELTAYFADFNNTAGATQAALREQSKALTFQWQLLKNNATALGITIGTLFLPVLKVMVGWMKQAVMWINNLSPTTKKWIAYIMLATATLIILKLALGGLIRHLLSMGMAAGRGLGGLLGLAAANPILAAIVVAIAAIAIAAYMYPEHFKRITDSVMGYVNTLLHAHIALQMILDGNLEGAKKHWKLMHKSSADAAQAWDDLWNKAYSTEVSKFVGSRKKKLSEFKRSADKEREMLREAGLSEEEIAEQLKGKREMFDRVQYDNMLKSYGKMDGKRKEEFAAELKLNDSLNLSLSDKERVAATEIITAETEKHGTLQRLRDEQAVKEAEGYRGALERVANFLRAWRTSETAIGQVTFAMVTLMSWGVLAFLSYLIPAINSMFDNFVVTLNNIWAAVRSGISIVIGWLVAAIGWIYATFIMPFIIAWHWAMSAMTWFVSGCILHLTNMYNWFARIFAAIWVSFVHTFAPMFTAVVQWLSPALAWINHAWHLIASYFSAGKARVGRIWNDCWRWVRDMGRDWMARIVQSVSAGWNNVVQSIRGWASHIKGNIVALWASAYNIVVRFINRIVDAVNSVIPGKSFDLKKATGVDVGAVKRAYGIGDGYGEGVGGGSKGVGGLLPAQMMPGAGGLDLSKITGYDKPSNSIEHMVNAIGDMLKKGVQEWFTKQFAQMIPGFGGGVGRSTSGLVGRLAQLAGIVSQMFGLVLTSGFRPGSITSSGRRSLHASGRAIDMSGSWGGMQAAAAWASRLPGAKEVIFNSREWVRGTGFSGNPHTDHVHIGMARMGALINRKRVIMAHKDELFLPAQYRKGLEKLMSGGGATKIIYQVNHIHVERPEPGADIAALKIAWYLKTEGMG